MSNARRQVSEASMGGFGVREVPALDQAKIELLELGEAGFRVFRPRDLDWTHDPWLVAKNDGSLWTLEGGMPLSGYRPNTNAVLVGKALSWAYLTSAAASGIGNAPRDLAELERRARHAEEEAERQAAERERNLAALRAAAMPVRAGDIDPALRFTLRGAAERIDQAGGKIEVDRGRLVVRLPSGSGIFGTAPLDAARVLYMAESAVVAALTNGEPLPDADVTPAGARRFVSAGRISAAEKARRVDATVNDLRIALLNPSVTGERRTLLKAELDALRLARIGVHCRGQRSYLNRLGITPPRT